MGLLLSITAKDWIIFANLPAAALFFPLAASVPALMQTLLDDSKSLLIRTPFRVELQGRRLMIQFKSSCTLFTHPCPQPTPLASANHKMLWKSEWT